MYLLLLISKQAVRIPANPDSSSNLDSQYSPDGRSRSTEPECELVDGAPPLRPSTGTDDAGRFELLKDRILEIEQQLSALVQRAPATTRLPLTKGKIHTPAGYLHSLDE